MAKPQNIACNECGTMITFTLKKIRKMDGLFDTKTEHETYVDSGTGEAPYGYSREKTCPQCGANVWMKYKK